MNKKYNMTLFLLFLIFLSAGIIFQKNKLGLRNYFLRNKTKIISYLKTNYGGIIYNKTSKTLKFSRDLRISSLPPGMSTRDRGFFDADSLIISEPTFYNDKVYVRGVLKFCDLANLEVIESGDILKIEAKNVWMCKILNDFAHYDSIKSAFKK